MYSYEEKMRAVELYLKYGLSAAAVINELEQHIKKNKLPAKDQRVVLSHNNYIMVVVRLSATIRHFRLQSKVPFRSRKRCRRPHFLHRLETCFGDKNEAHSFVCGA